MRYYLLLMTHDSLTRALSGLAGLCHQQPSVRYAKEQRTLGWTRFSDWFWRPSTLNYAVLLPWKSTHRCRVIFWRSRPQEEDLVITARSFLQDIAVEFGDLAGEDSSYLAIAAPKGRPPVV